MTCEIESGEIMQINAYYWQMYLLAGGRKTVERFESCLHGNWQDLCGLIEPLFKAYCPDTFLAQSIGESIEAFAACASTVPEGSL